MGEQFCIILFSIGYWLLPLKPMGFGGSRCEFHRKRKALRSSEAISYRHCRDCPQYGMDSMNNRNGTLFMAVDNP
jgi:hypothetical protein